MRAYTERDRLYDILERCRLGAKRMQVRASAYHNRAKRAKRNMQDERADRLQRISTAQRDAYISLKGVIKKATAVAPIQDSDLRDLAMVLTVLEHTAVIQKDWTEAAWISSDTRILALDKTKHDISAVRALLRFVKPSPPLGGEGVPDQALQGPQEVHTEADVTDRLHSTPVPEATPEAFGIAPEPVEEEFHFDPNEEEGDEHP